MEWKDRKSSTERWQGRGKASDPLPLKAILAAKVSHPTHAKRARGEQFAAYLALQPDCVDGEEWKPRASVVVLSLSVAPE